MSGPAIPAPDRMGQRGMPRRPEELPALNAAGGLHVEHAKPILSVALIADAVLVAARPAQQIPSGRDAIRRSQGRSGRGHPTLQVAGPALTDAAQTFSILNVRSATDDLKAAAVIREAAMRLFAERGTAAVTVREIAAAAGVSPSLVMHHYGSKDGLRDAVDRRAAAFFEEMLGELARIGEQGGSASLAELFAARLEAQPVMADYVRRLLLDGGEAADALFSKLFGTTLAGMRSLVEAGVVRPAQDEETRTAFLLANDLSLVLLRRQITSVTGTDPLTRDGLARWTAAAMDVYTGGIFAPPAGPAGPGKPAFGQPAAGGEPYR